MLSLYAISVHLVWLSVSRMNVSYLEIVSSSRKSCTISLRVGGGMLSNYCPEMTWHPLHICQTCFWGRACFIVQTLSQTWPLTVNLHMHAKCNRPIWGKAGWMTREMQSRIVSLFLDCFPPWGLTAELTDFHDLTSWHWDVSNQSWWRWCSSLWWSMTHTHALSSMHTHANPPPLQFL